MPVFTITTPRPDAAQALVVRRQPGFSRLLISSADTFVSHWRFEFAAADVEDGALERVMRSLRDAGIDADKGSDERSEDLVISLAGVADAAALAATSSLPTARPLRCETTHVGAVA